MLPTGEKEYEWNDKLVNFVFDNADINTHTLTGHGSWHVLGGIASVTPAGECVEQVLPRLTNIQPATNSGRYGEIQPRKYRKPQVPPLKRVFIGPLEISNTNHPVLRVARALDSIWMVSFIVSEPGRCSLWSGFNQTVMNQGHYDVSRIDILPFINLDPNNPDTLYSALHYTQDLCEKYKLGIAPVTYDQSLYQKAAEIVQSPELNKIIIILGGFHLMMSYIGAMGHIMGGVGCLFSGKLGIKDLTQ